MTQHENDRDREIDRFYRELNFGLQQLYRAGDALKLIARTIAEDTATLGECIGDLNEVRSLIFSSADDIISSTWWHPHGGASR